MDFGDKIEHPAFGLVGISRVSGRRNLFQVDHPQEHYITLTVKRATLHRSDTRDWVFGNEEIVEIALSETQYARMISTPNHGDGVPCTLCHYHDGRQGEFVQVTLPDDSRDKAETFSAAVRNRAEQASQEVSGAMAQIDAILAGGPVRKSDLQAVRESLRSAIQNVSDNLPYVVKEAEQAINDSAMKAQAEISAFVEHSMARLGERALGDRLQSVLEAGGNAADFGRLIADATTIKEPGA